MNRRRGAPPIVVGAVLPFVLEPEEAGAQRGQDLTPKQPRAERRNEGSPTSSRGNVASGLARRSAGSRIAYDRLHNAQMEPRVAVAAWERQVI
jgi:hypothetical protein